MSLNIEPIKARLAASCQGPWKGFTFRRPIDGNCYIIVREDDPHVIAATLVPQYGDNDTAVMLLHSRADMDALVAEVERLRVIIADLRLMVDGLEKAAHEERASVVAWLHREAIRKEAGAIPWDDSELRQAADSIERGEHRREEER